MEKERILSDADFSKFLFGISTKPLRVIDQAIPNSKYIPLDISISNDAIHTLDMSNVGDLQSFINNKIEEANGLVAFGGYLEHRALYDRSDYFNSNLEATTRNIHLGMDLWLSDGSAIYSPLDGIVHSFNNNQNFGDYGPTIILKHEISGQVFYTLYGHLSSESLDGLEKGKPIKNGEVLATLGSVEVNGNYPPHLHFQVIKDLQGNVGDYPGVSSKNLIEFYKMNCPDPNLLLKIY